MKKFTDFSKKSANIKKIFEQEISLQKEEIPSEKKEEIIDNTKLSTSLESEKENSTTVKLFSKLFESREMAHVYHLQVKGDNGSYAAHVALNAYYDGVIDLLDEIIEVYQGQYGIIEEYDVIDTKDTKTKDKVEYFEDLAVFIKKERVSISNEDTHLQNIIDEIVAMIYKTIYKLKFNK